MPWQRVEIDRPLFRTRKQGRDRYQTWQAGREVMVIMRVVSPTVAYMRRASVLETFMHLFEPDDTPFLGMVRRPVHSTNMEWAI